MRTHSTPGEQVVASLRRSKQRGLDFQQAWQHAMRSVRWMAIDSPTARDDWRKVLADEAIEAECRAAYLDLPTGVGHRFREWRERPEPPELVGDGQLVA